MAKSSSLSKTAVWILLGLLILGLGGFGAANLSGNLRSLGTVGDKQVSVQQYARGVQQALRELNRQTGQAVSFSQAQAMGLDRSVLQQLIRERALDHESELMGLSVGDETLRDRILEISAFDGIDGEFDREGYRQSLRQAGLTETEFETAMREEAARTLLQGAVLSGVQMPESYARTLVNYVRQERDFTWTLLDDATLDAEIATPDEATLTAYFEANRDDYILPPSKSITYARLSPDALIDQVEVSEAELREAYESRMDEFNQPERRLIERLVFADQEAADQAAAALEVGGTSFEALVEERGLALSDVDLGDVSQQELGAAGTAVFDAEVFDVVGPAPSSLGPALYRVNGVLPAQNVTFQEAQAELRDALAADRAIRLVEAQAEDFDNRLAGGSTLEQLAEETDMTLGQIFWTEGSTDDIAAYEAFRDVAASVTAEDFPKIEQLADGGIFAARLDDQLPQRPAEFADVADQVAQDWRADQVTERLTSLAEAALPQIEETGDFTASGFDAMVETDQIRSGFIPDTPRGFMAAVFEMTEGETRIISGEGTVAIVRLDAINTPEDDADAQAIIAGVREQQSNALARGLFNIYADDVLLRAGQNIDPRAVAAVNVNF